MIESLTSSYILADKNNCFKYLQIYLMYRNDSLTYKNINRNIFCHCISNRKKIFDNKKYETIVLWQTSKRPAIFVESVIFLRHVVGIFYSRVEIASINGVQTDEVTPSPSNYLTCRHNWRRNHEKPIPCYIW